MDSSVVAEFEKASIKVHAYVELIKRTSDAIERDRTADGAGELLKILSLAHQKASGLRTNLANAHDALVAMNFNGNGRTDAGPSGVDAGPSTTTTAPPPPLARWTKEAQQLARLEHRQMMIGNLPSSTTKRDIAELLGGPDDIVHTTHLLTHGYIHGHFAYVTFKTASQVDSAIAAVNGKQVGEKFLFAGKCEPDPTPAAPAAAAGSKRSTASDAASSREERPERSTKRARTMGPNVVGSVGSQFQLQQGVEEEAEYIDISNEVTERLERQRLARERSTTPGGSWAKRKFGERAALGGVNEEREGVEEQGQGAVQGTSPPKKKIRATGEAGRGGQAVLSGKKRKVIGEEDQEEGSRAKS